jgi:hypothetical protein
VAIHTLDHLSPFFQLFCNSKITSK